MNMNWKRYVMSRDPDEKHTHIHLKTSWDHPLVGDFPHASLQAHLHSRALYSGVAQLSP